MHAVLAGALVTLFFAWNGSQMFENLEAKRSTMLGDTPTFISITEARALMIVPSVFSVMAGLIVEMLFMLFSVYNTAQWTESELMQSVLANRFSTNNLLDTPQELISK